MSIQRVQDLVGNRLDYLAFFITGVTPGSINVKIDELLPNMSLPIIQKLCNVSLIAAASNRPNVISYIGKAENADLSRYIAEHFYIQDHVNFSALNLFGHMLLAGGLRSRYNFVDEYRRKLGGISIWHTNLGRSELSEIQKGILEEKVRRIPRDVALVPSRDLVVKLANRLRILQNPNVAPGTNNDNAPETGRGSETATVFRTVHTPVFAAAGVTTHETGSSSRTATEVPTESLAEEARIIEERVVTETERLRTTEIAIKAAEEARVIRETKLAAEIARKAAEEKRAEDVRAAELIAAERAEVERTTKEAADKEAEEARVIDPGAKAAEDARRAEVEAKRKATVDVSRLPLGTAKGGRSKTAVGKKRKSEGSSAEEKVTRSGKVRKEITEE